MNIDNNGAGENAADDMVAPVAVGMAREADMTWPAHARDSVRCSANPRRIRNIARATRRVLCQGTGLSSQAPDG